jgi:hypothetical protein
MWSRLSRKSKEEQFWDWFIRHEEKLLNFEVDQERIFDKLANALQRVDRDLTFEFGPPEIQRELVISASGIYRAFPAVSALVAAAPTLERWRWTAFRPRRSVGNPVEFQGKCIYPTEVEFALADNGKIAGLYLFLPDFSEGDTALKMIGYLLLDEALGEFDVVTRLGFVEMRSRDTPPDTTGMSKRYPLFELPRLFDQLNLQLERGESPRSPLVS